MKSVLQLILKVLVTVAMLASAATQSQAQPACVTVGLYVPPSWSQSLTPASTRFNVLSSFGCAAVLDRETGLVWEQSPAQTPLTWAAALDYCTTKLLGAKVGWRLPTVEELGSLVQPVFPQNIGLPAGHPFNLAQSTINNFWSSTTWASDPNSAWFLQQPFTVFPPSPPLIFPVTPLFTTVKSQIQTAWCVRGGHGYDAR